MALAAKAATLALVLFFARVSFALKLGQLHTSLGAEYFIRSESRPGVPNVTMWQGAFPYDTNHPERSAWGERLLKTVMSPATEEQCGGWVNYGDFVWCSKAMAKETAGAQLSNPRHGQQPGFYGPVVKPSHPEVLKDLPEDGSQFVGLSYGIRDRDMWSELLSKRYLIPTVLHDCYYNKPQGPMGPDNFYSKEQCPHSRDAICFNAHYEAKHVCLGTENRTIMSDDRRTLRFETLKDHLKGRAPLSTFLHIDVEGSEWEVLEQLLNSEEDMAKIRGIDMEAHLNLYASGTQNHGHDHIEQKVTLMEKLSEKFVVTGSTIAAQHQLDERNRVSGYIAPGSRPSQEPAVWARNGFSLNQYCVSFVNPKLLV